MRPQPLGQRLCVAPEQQVDWLTQLEIDQNRGVALTTAQSQIIHAEHAWRLNPVLIASAEQSEQRVRTDWQTGSVRQTGSRFSAHHPGKLNEERVSVGGALRTSRQCGREALCEGAPRTVRVRTAKAANPQDQAHRTP